MPGPSFAVLGTGALGGYYGCLLARAGFDVHFLLHTDYAHVVEHGLRLDSKDGGFHLEQVRAYADAAAMPPCDFALVALKTVNNHLLPRLLPPVLKPGGTGVILQNGLGLEEEAARAVGEDRVIGGLCFLCANKSGPGHICHLDYGRVVLAEFHPGGGDREETPRLSRLREAFEIAGISVSIQMNLARARWEKLVWNIPYNGLCAVLDADTATVMSDPDASDLAEDLMREVAVAASACGHAIDEGFIQKMLTYTRRMIPYRPSMLLDVRGGRPMELEAIYAEPLRRARAVGCALPRVETLYRQLMALDRMGRSPAAHPSPPPTARRAGNGVA